MKNLPNREEDKSLAELQDAWDVKPEFTAGEMFGLVARAIMTILLAIALVGGVFWGLAQIKEDAPVDMSMKSPTRWLPKAN